MSQAEIVKSRIVDIVRAPSDPRPTHAQEPAPPQRQTLALTRLPDPAPAAVISTFAWHASPVTVVEEVELPKRVDPRLTVLIDPGSAQARSYRLLQHRLYASRDPRVVTVTSAGSGEGKTTCAANLALVLSEETLARVLLVDANLLRPGVAELFGFDPADSFMTKLLRNEDAAPPYAVASVFGRRLQLAALQPEVTRGKRVDRALLGEALRELRRSYDYIVIDAASVLESADVNSVCQCSDGVLVAARAGRTRKSALSRSVDQLQPANVIGTVLIDA